MVVDLIVYLLAQTRIVEMVSNNPYYFHHDIKSQQTITSHYTQEWFNCDHIHEYNDTYN